MYSAMDARCTVTIHILIYKFSVNVTCKIGVRFFSPMIYCMSYFILIYVKIKTSFVWLGLL